MAKPKDYHHIIRRCQTLNAMVKRLTKLQENMTGPGITADIRRRRHLSIQVAQEKIALQEHELHCEMVDLGVADVNEDRYGNVSLILQFGPTVLYFRKPGETSVLPADGKDKDNGLTPLGMEVEDKKRPILTDPTGSLTTIKDEVEEDEEQEDVDVEGETDDDEEDDGTWYAGDDVATLESYLRLHQAKSDRGEVNHLEHFKQKLKIAKAKAGIEEPKPEKTKAPAKAKKTVEPAPEPPPPAVTMKLSEATKLWKKSGKVPDGFQVIGENLYKIAAGPQPAKEVKPPAQPVKTEKAKTPPVEKTEEPEARKEAVDGPFGSSGMKGGNNKDLIW